MQLTPTWRGCAQFMSNSTRRSWTPTAGRISPLDHGFHTYRQMERWTVSPAARVEILDRLLEENHRRAATDAAVAKPKRTGRRSEDAPEGEGTLFS